MITSNGGVVVIVIGECVGDEWRWDWIEEWWSDENKVWELWKEIMKSRESEEKRVRKNGKKAKRKMVLFLLVEMGCLASV
jgi:predicted SnoaL-like aldol condensation-catalyzing enzyme